MASSNGAAMIIKDSTGVKVTADHLVCAAFKDVYYQWMLYEGYMEELFYRTDRCIFTSPHLTLNGPTQNLKKFGKMIRHIIHFTLS